MLLLRGVRNGEEVDEYEDDERGAVEFGCAACGETRRWGSRMTPYVVL